jgi:hypothetical protein
MKLRETPTRIVPVTEAGQRRPPRRAAPPFGAGWSLDVVLLSFLAAAPVATRRRRRARRSRAQSQGPTQRQKDA